jgi:hypothetical protein
MEFTINGTVTNALNKPVEKSNVVLFSRSPFMVKDTLTDKAGRFHFRNLFPVDTAIFKLQARNKNGKEFNVGITIDKVKPPEFTSSIGITPWYVNSDTIRLKNTSAKSAQQKAIANYKGEGQMLKEVTIKEKKIVKGSKNLNGPGEADQILDEEEMKKADKMTLANLLEQKVKGFNTGYYPSRAPTRQSYRIYNSEVRFIIDGMDLDFFYEGGPETPIDLKRYYYMRQYLNYFSAEDIIGIEVMYNPRYNDRYFINFYPQLLAHPPYAFIEITTRSKKGPFMQITPGTYLHKTLAFTLPKQFYSPKYTVKNKTVAIGTDMRSTIHWEPNIITDKDGKVTVSFYSADKPSAYTIIVEGINVDSGAGYLRQKLNPLQFLNN